MHVFKSHCSQMYYVHTTFTIPNYCNLYLGIFYFEVLIYVEINVMIFPKHVLAVKFELRAFF